MKNRVRKMALARLRIEGKSSEIGMWVVFVLLF